MTLAIGFAVRSDDVSRPELSNVYVMADSRLTVGDKALDSYLKTATLGQRSAAVAAGDTIPFVIAVEAARPFIAVNASERIKRGLAPLSVWSEASFVWLHLERTFNQFQDLVSDAGVTIIVAGFFSDNTPGLIQMERRGELRQISVFRPRPGQRAYVVAGVEYYVPLLKEALRRSSPPEGRGYHDVASVLWDVIKHQGTPARGVGGGLSLGFANGDSGSFQWPNIQIEGTTFVRGITYPPHPWWPSPLRIEYDPSLFAALEIAHADRPFPNQDTPTRAVMAANVGVLAGDPRLFFVDWDDAWILKELQREEVSPQQPR
jgi:hypothetical protein